MEHARVQILVVVAITHEEKAFAP